MMDFKVENLVDLGTYRSGLSARRPLRPGIAADGKTAICA